MLRKLAVVLAGVVALALSACAGAPQLTFAQQVSIACGAANGEIAILKGDGVFTGGAADTLNKTVQPDVDKVCAVGATITDANLTNIVNATLPLIKSLVDSSSLSPGKIKAADAAIDTGVLAFNIAISLAPAVSAAAPVAASTPLSGAPLQ
jgi:hypothetical protein